MIWFKAILMGLLAIFRMTTEFTWKNNCLRLVRKMLKRGNSGVSPCPIKEKKVLYKVVVIGVIQYKLRKKETMERIESQEKDLCKYK